MVEEEQVLRYRIGVEPCARLVVVTFAAALEATPSSARRLMAKAKLMSALDEERIQIPVSVMQNPTGGRAIGISVGGCTPPARDPNMLKFRARHRSAVEVLGFEPPSCSLRAIRFVSLCPEFRACGHREHRADRAGLTAHIGRAKSRPCRTKRRASVGTPTASGGTGNVCRFP